MKQNLRQMVFGAINVPLAIFWSDPGNQEYQKISWFATTNPMSWSESLDVQQRLWLVEKVNTMVVFGRKSSNTERPKQLAASSRSSPTYKG